MIPLAQTPPFPVVVYVEDDPAAVTLFELVLSDIQSSSKLFSIGSGQSALKFLKREPPYETALRPDLVILDVHLPDQGGFYILEMIRGDRKLAGLPVVFFSTFILPADRKRATVLGVLDYLEKPPSLGEFEQAVKSMYSLLQ